MKRGRVMVGVVSVLLLLTAGVWAAVCVEGPTADLRVSFLDVGEGDSIYIRSPSGGQMLIDGGPDGSVLRALSGVAPWFDRSLDVLLATHPDSDHIAGLISVLDRYQVGLVVVTSVETDSSPSRAFQEAISKNGAKRLTALRGQVIHLGNGAYFEVLFPDRAVPGVDTNVGCVVGKLVYGSTSFMLSCDSPQSVERYLVTLDGHSLKSSVLKAGHHGSKTSSLPLFVGFVDPEFIVFSRGCDNKYGFPHQETLATAKQFGLTIADTCKDGTVTFVSDGKRVRRE